MAASIKMKNSHIFRVFQKYLNKSRLNVCRSRSTSTALAQENQEDVEYPPIKPRYPPGSWGTMDPKECWKWHEKKEELMKYNTIWRRLLVLSDELKYHCKINIPDHTPRTLPFFQDVTKTVVVDGLPEVYQEIQFDEQCEKLAPLVIDAILTSHENESRDLARSQNFPKNSDFQNTYQQQRLINILNRILPVLSLSAEHLLKSQISEGAKVQSYWERGGFPPSRADHSMGQTGYKKDVLRCYSKSVLNVLLRTENPLPLFVNKDDPLCEAELPEWPCGPRPAGIQVKKNRIRYLAGYKTIDPYYTGAPCEFGHTGFLTTTKLDKMAVAFPGFETEFLKKMMVTGLFNWCLAQSFNQGFTHLSDVTYPFTSQMVAADGQKFAFGSYQLNTIQLFKGPGEGNDVTNICWVKNFENLYETVENDEVRGFNMDTLRQLVKFLSLKTVDRGVEMRPYLPKIQPKLGDFPLYHPLDGPEGPLPVENKTFINDKVHKEEIIIEEKFVDER
ncbi:unnamed protein product [Owenia fusiformis]|uniref:39S ribosomal protein L37, mitochondrial n=1 Tax=Owenia fusiformis TaxID=6347 RepID=A0A8S4PYG6_OWEFU|nr:unnamed protein product [Owenia fusiformis]